MKGSPCAAKRSRAAYALVLVTVPIVCNKRNACNGCYMPCVRGGRDEEDDREREGEVG
jgi:hypothetical protein